MNLTPAQITALSEALPAIIGLASLLLTVIPHPAKYNSLFGVLRRILDVLAANVGHGAVSTVAQGALQGQPGAAALAPSVVKAIADNLPQTAAATSMQKGSTP